MKRLINAATGFVICISFLLCSCSKEPLQEPAATKTTPTLTTEYCIRQGNHYPEQNTTAFMVNPVIDATVTFDSSAVYTTRSADNQGDVNKLIGFSDGGTNHQENSARLGWSWNGQKVVLYAYAYVNKTRVIKMLDMVTVNQPFTCSVKAEKDYYAFTVNNHTDTVQRYTAGYTGLRYKLFPYFGGDEAAPHDVRIRIKEAVMANESAK